VYTFEKSKSEHCTAFCKQNFKSSHRSNSGEIYAVNFGVWSEKTFLLNFFGYEKVSGVMQIIVS